MSFSYSGNPSASPLDECRFLISDTDKARPIFQDEEINFIIAQSGSDVALLRYNLFSQAATTFARDIKRSLGPQSEDPTARLAYFRQQADSYKAKIAARGLSLPQFNYPKVFYKGMHSNPPWPSKE